ncbi:MAG: hypothetical protein MJA83_03470 [Gammaproteobacteria bacterium]|nr:hypothetical protein [Gammaproteobacteria bacterium]
MSRLLSISTAILLSFCVAGFAFAAKEKYPKNSIGGNKRIPKAALEKGIGDDAERAALMRATYDGYVMLAGRLQSDGTFTFTSVRKSDPEGKYDKKALKHAERVSMRAFTTGSHMRPSARAHVLVYEAGNESKADITDRELIVVLTEKNPPPGSAASRPSYRVYTYEGDR